MFTFVVATRNQHKLGEIQAILGDQAACRSMDAWPQAPQLTEDADTFAGNASTKARQLADWLTTQPDVPPCYILADDSGLEVDALNGAPGVLSARFAAEETGRNASDAANNAKLIRLLDGVPLERRTARFRCAVALVEMDTQGIVGSAQVFEGTCEGRIAFQPSGEGGFGYDPLFLPSGQQVSFAELNEAEKNRLSHRAVALEALKAWMRGRGRPRGKSAS